MKITSKQYAQALFELVEGKTEEELSSVLSNFVETLAAHNQITKIDGIINHFETLWNKENGIVNAEIISANKLDSSMIDILKDYITKNTNAKDIQLKTKVNKNILGGVVIKYGDTIFDASLKNRLQDLKHILSNN